MRHTRDARYRILVRNRPGELARLADALVRHGLPLSGLRVASLGATAQVSIPLPSPAGASRLSRAGFKARPA